MNHPVLTSIAAIDAALDEVADVSPVHMSVTEKQAALTRLARTRSRVEAIELRLLAASDDIAVATGARSTAAWVADQTRQAHGTLRRHATLAAALDTRWVHTADGLAAGTINLAQAGVIVDALDALPPRPRRRLAHQGRDLPARPRRRPRTARAAQPGPRHP